MRDARCQQPDRAELIGLHQLAFEFVTIGHVIENDQPANLFEILRGRSKAQSPDSPVIRRLGGRGAMPVPTRADRYRSE